MCPPCGRRAVAVSGTYRSRRVVDWEYRKIALNDHSSRSDDIDLLSALGEEGWELLTITANNIAYLKRPLHEPPEDREPVEETKPELVAPTRGYEAKAKYRDPVTGDTWSGRGRMATWLKLKQDAGEDIEKYRV